MLCAESELCRQDEAHLASVLDLGAHTVEGLGLLREEGSLFDLHIKVEKVIFKAHKVFLAAVSGHFLQILTENENDGIVSVELEGVAADDMKVLLDFLYEQHLELTMANVSDILHVAVHLQVEVLVVRCCNFLVKSFNKDNCLEILEIARVFQLAEVHQEALSFVSAYWSEMKDLLCRLDKEDLVSLLKGPFCSESEVDLFAIAKSWVEASAENLACVHDVMTWIKFPLMSERELEEIQESTPFLKTEPCCGLIEEARNYHKLEACEKVLVKSQRTSVRGTSQNVVFGTGYSPSVGANDFTAPYLLDFSSNLSYRWISLPAIEQALGVASVVVINNFVVACGVGRFLTEGDEVKSECGIFDPRSYSWLPISSMEHARVDFPLVAVGEVMYAIGGSTKWRSVDPISSVEVYHFKDNKWSSVKEMPEKVTNHAACESGGKIFVCGGIKADKSVSSSMWMYDPATDIWTDLPKLPAPEQGHSLLPLTPNKLFLISSTSGKIYPFDIATNEWSDLVASDQNQPLPAHVAVCQYTPHLAVISWLKDTPAQRDENNAAAGDSDAGQVSEDSEQAVQFVTASGFKSPWVTKRLWKFPEGVFWRHCTSLTLPWKVLCRGRVSQQEDQENVMLELLRNISLA